MSELVSIVIPTYNRARFVAEAVDSALGQTYQNVEVIVIDDGSTDNTSDICKRYGEKIRYIRKPNGGIGSALNAGIRNMSGSWFKWLSSDDVLYPSSVEELVKVAAHTGEKILYSDYERIDEDGRVLAVHQEPNLGHDEFCATIWLAGRWFIGNGSSILIHRSCFEKVGLFDEQLRFQEDYDWWLRASLIHGYHFIRVPKVLLKYRIHKNQLTATVSHNSMVNSELIRRRVKNHILSTDPEKWRTLSRNFRYYNRYRSVSHGLIMISRRILMVMPSRVRKTVLQWWLLATIRKHSLR